MNTVDYRMWGILQEKVYKHASLIWTCRRRHWWMAAAMTTWSGSAWPTPFPVAVSVCPDQWWVFWTPSLAIFPTLCNQLDSNLANLEATVKVE